MDELLVGYNFDNFLLLNVNILRFSLKLLNTMPFCYHFRNCPLKLRPAIRIRSLGVNNIYRK